MNLFKSILLLISMVFCSHVLLSQNGVGVQLNKELLKIEKFDFNYQPINVQQYSILQKIKNNIPDAYSKNIDQSSILFNCNELAPFCRLELKMEKVAKFPIKFRIGEVQYVERMEGKY